MSTHRHVLKARSRSRTVRAATEITIPLCSGSLDHVMFAEWLQAAIADYHRFRGGHVGMAASVKIKLPIVEVVSLR